MPNPVEHEQYEEGGEKLSLTQAARLPILRRNGRSPHATTLFRWAIRGRRGVLLRTEVIGGVRVTTRHWLRIFIDDVTNASTSSRTTGYSSAGDPCRVDTQLDIELGDST
jgi:hypothetical protein